MGCADVYPLEGAQLKDFGRILFVPPVGVIAERPFRLRELGFLQAPQIGKIQIRELLLAVGNDVEADLAFDWMDDDFHIGILYQRIAAVVACVAEYFRLEHVFEVQRCDKVPRDLAIGGNDWGIQIDERLVIQKVFAAVLEERVTVE